MACELVFVNKVLLEYSHAYLFAYLHVVCKGRVEQFATETLELLSLKYFLSDLYRKSLQIPDLNNKILNLRKKLD